ncbi:MAG: hypothetical protein U1A28_01935 [Patescibacteria group bacterium]|nr:hypothetical protein [Patescibacteria group bacterium]
MTALIVVFLSSLGALAALFILAARQMHVGRRFGGTRREAADAVVSGAFDACRSALGADSRVRACVCIARSANAVIEQFSRVRAPSALISQRATNMMFASKRALAATSTASPFLRKMAGYKERVADGK